MYISSFRPTLGFLPSFLSLLVLGFSVNSLRVHSFELPLREFCEEVVEGVFDGVLSINVWAALRPLSSAHTTALRGCSKKTLALN